MLQGVGGEHDVKAGVGVGKSADVLVACAVYELSKPLGTPIVREGQPGQLLQQSVHRPYRSDSVDFGDVEVAECRVFGQLD
jgi:hypothetical protein